MSKLLKDLYNQETIGDLAKSIKNAYKDFNTNTFMSQVFDDNWENLELKDRGRRINLVLGDLLPQDYPKALKIMEAACIDLPVLFIFPDFIELYGQNEEDWDISLASLGFHTQYWSSEFAVRPFIVNDEERMMNQMYEWSKHENEHYRRLASEGCRPQLPWAASLVKYKQDPQPIFRILEELKDDPSLYVRRSVANNLNDISKTHPELVIAIAKDWYGHSEERNWIVKHACRTLLKQGNQEILDIFGFHSDIKVSISNFEISKPVLKIGESFVFSFDLNLDKDSKLRIEYALGYVKANGKINKKIFQISERKVLASQTQSIKKKHSFADMSVRKHYPGLHTLTLIVNGRQVKEVEFELKA